MSVIVQTKGAQLSVRDSGGDGAPIVFLSGGPGMPDYLKEIAKLVPGRWVVSYDQQGTGASAVTNGDYSTEAHVADLESLREHLGVEHLHLFGHSWGGMLSPGQSAVTFFGSMLQPVSRSSSSRSTMRRRKLARSRSQIASA